MYFQCEECFLLWTSHGVQWEVDFFYSLILCHKASGTVGAAMSFHQANLLHTLAEVCRGGSWRGRLASAPSSIVLPLGILILPLDFTVLAWIHACVLPLHLLAFLFHFRHSFFLQTQAFPSVYSWAKLPEWTWRSCWGFLVPRADWAPRIPVGIKLSQMKIYWVSRFEVFSRSLQSNRGKALDFFLNMYIPI